MLYLVPTPIGNLEDITLRALRVLREADIIACEDTRTSSILLRHYGINKPLTSYHQYNENEKLPQMLTKLRKGQNIAVITDAGTPGISDPGLILLQKAQQEALPVDVLPGPSAVIPAVLLSGIIPQPFMFLAFPPEKHNSRKELFTRLEALSCTLIFYLSPHKAAKHISDMIDTWGNRRASLIREISKIHQEAIHSDLTGILERVSEGVKGELVLVVAGHQERENPSWHDEAVSLYEDGHTVRDIVNALDGRASRNEIKKFLLNIS